MRRYFLTTLVGLALVAGGVFAAACGDDDDSPAETPTATATDAPGDATPSEGNGATGDGITTETGLTISGAWARSTGNTVGAVYFVIENSGEADRLVSAASDLTPMVQVHEVVTEGLTQRMQEMKDGLVIPAGQAVELKPGGYHIMLMDLSEPLAEGDEIRISLNFERAGTVELQVPVGAPSEEDHDHGHDDHDNGDEHHDDDHDDHDGH